METGSQPVYLPATAANVKSLGLKHRLFFCTKKFCYISQWVKSSGVYKQSKYDTSGSTATIKLLIGCMGR